jgi:hypothetical protein
VKAGWSIQETGRTYKISEYTFWFHIKASIPSTAQLFCKPAFTPDQE